MDKKLEPIIKAVQAKFGATFEEFRDEVHLFVKPEQIVEVSRSELILPVSPVWKS